ncbi:glutamate decarboxylase [Chloropicon primus]|uniref:Glutamate decarboxylase n=1 Tax=Chloropicon primus TaxID=1764295 RepID=A0A5B8MD54_9CHLO|nr:glutamate decarboxylase [Chloropicon primus]UPQ97685.1 glutamate decarboxylase [Chloropicon primus]|mmetsp:Transcript_4497/g.13315  ORF Transcript_4497/g.13315 Transcript_4497/m.13315 type:complete len:474 (+) Transcript_4497:1419-2840(+)|eukprot:QDZ18476.1 glutamate decarboxylase [Chloropicon primus]
MSGKRKKMEEGGAELEKCSSYTFATRYTANEIPKFQLPDNGEPAHVAKQLIDDERMLDRNPRLNLASFVTTWMEPEVEELIKKSLNVNYVDVAQYPSCLEIQNRCVAMLADLFHAEGKGEDACGTACIGSSEAIMLCGLNLKMRWKEKMKVKGKPATKPNLIMGANVQVCWEKFCRYFEVEERYVFLKEGQYALKPEDVAPLVDENTIGCVAILGSTYDGQFEDCLGVSNALDKVQQETGLDVPIHVDGASGAFVAPFLFPDLVWDFQVPRVLSINASGHKYGLVYPGLGWAIWKGKQFLHEDMVFHTNYLGSDQPSITLNFSKGASAIVAQYYQLIRLGRSGYRKIMQNLAKVAKHLETRLLETKHFKILNKPVGVPLVAFSLTDHPGGHKRNYDEFNLADKLKETGWVLPAYTMAPNAGHIKLLRAVIREDMSYALCEKLVEDVLRAISYLDQLQHELPSSNQVFLHKGPC